jgi:hypothetical protein
VFGGVSSNKIEGVPQTQLSLQQYLEQPMFRKGARVFTVRKMIEYFANSDGGAHYASITHPEKLPILALRSIAPGVLENMMFQIARTTVDVGSTILRLSTGWELHLALAIRKHGYGGDRTIFDSRAGPMRASLVLTASGHLRLRVIGIDGAWAVVETTEPAELDNPQHLIVRQEMTESLGSELTIIVNGDVRAGLECPKAIWFYNDPRSRETLYNRSFESDSDGVEVVLFGRAHLGAGVMRDREKWDAANSAIKDMLSDPQSGKRLCIGQWIREVAPQVEYFPESLATLTIKDCLARVSDPPDRTHNSY